MHEGLELRLLARRRQVLDRDDQRRVARRSAARRRRSSVSLVEAPAGCPWNAPWRCCARTRLRCLRFARWAPARDDLVDVDARVPEVERPHRRRTRASPRGTRAPTARLIGAALLGVEAAIAAGDGEARDEPLDVPLERAGQRLVEVVDVEDQPAVGRGEGTEVRQVRVAAELDLAARCAASPARSAAIEVGRAAEERERRHEHPPVADRHELGHARRGLLLEQSTGSRRSAAGFHSPWVERGTSARAALPVAARSPTVRCTTAFGRGRRVSRGGAVAR